MIKERIPKEGKPMRPRRSEGKDGADGQPTGSAASPRLSSLHRHIGNRAVQRLIAQRSEQAPSEVDDATAEKINRERSGGQPLEGSLQASMSQAMGSDLSAVRVHTSPESDVLNRQLGAKAFTTGQDVFFREGAYDPHSTGGQELIAHELTHVVQQGSGRVSRGGRMTVNAPGDAYEREADAVASQAVSEANAVGARTATGGVQRQEEEEDIQAQAVQRQEEEEDIQAQGLQRQVEPEEEEEIQTQALQRQVEPEEEEEIQTQALQRQEEIPEEEV